MSDNKLAGTLWVCSLIRIEVGAGVGSFANYAKRFADQSSFNIWMHNYRSNHLNRLIAVQMSFFQFRCVFFSSDVSVESSMTRNATVRFLYTLKK